MRWRRLGSHRIFLEPDRQRAFRARTNVHSPSLPLESSDPTASLLAVPIGASTDESGRSSAERIAARRQRVIEAAAALMVRDGFHAVSMQAVARQAQVSVGSLYQYLDNKDDLLLAVITSVLERFARDLPAAMDGVVDPVRRLAAGFDAYCRVLDRHLDVAVLAYRESRTLERRGRHLVQQLEIDTTQPLADAIADGQGAGTLDAALPADLVAYDMVVLAQGWALKHWHFGGLVDLDGYIATQLAVVLRSLVVPRRRRAYADLLHGAAHVH